MKRSEIRLKSETFHPCESLVSSFRPTYRAEGAVRRKAGGSSGRRCRRLTAGDGTRQSNTRPPRR